MFGDIECLTLAIMACFDPASHHKEQAKVKTYQHTSSKRIAPFSLKAAMFDLFLWLAH